MVDTYLYGYGSSRLHWLVLRKWNGIGLSILLNCDVLFTVFANHHWWAFGKAKNCCTLWGHGYGSGSGSGSPGGRRNPGSLHLKMSSWEIEFTVVEPKWRLSGVTYNRNPQFRFDLTEILRNSAFLALFIIIEMTTIRKFWKMKRFLLSKSGLKHSKFVKKWNIWQR